jgi:hypothetical protein
VGIGEGAGEASEKSLSQSHAEFSKAVQWVQREAATGLTKVAIVHLALRGYSVEDLKGFNIALTATSAMEELYRIETWQTRVGVMADLKDLGWFPKEWIVTHFTDLTPDEIEELKEMEQVESEGGSGGGIPGGLDLGGEEAGGEADLGDLGGEESADAGADESAEAEAAPDLGLEGFDYDAERRLLFEMKAQGKRSVVKRLVVGWAEKLGKPMQREIVEHASGYTHFMESKELDGLSQSVPDTDQHGMNIADDLRICNPNNDEKLLVEWSVDEKTRSEVIKETYVLLTIDQANETTATDEITESDVRSLQ